MARLFTALRVLNFSKSNLAIRSVAKAVILALSLWTTFSSSSVFANSAAVQSFTYEGKLYGTAGSPLAETVSFRIQILNSAADCVLYEEKQTFNLASTAGRFALEVGSDVAAGKRTASDPGFAMWQVFKNTGSLAVPAGDCPGTPFNPALGEKRKLRVFVDPASGSEEKLTPDQNITSAPSSMMSQSLQGIGADGFVQITGNITQSNLDDLASEHSDLMDLAAGTSALYMPAGSAVSTDDVFASDQMAIGTLTPAAGVEFEIQNNDPTLRLEATDGGAGQMAIQFFDTAGTDQAQIMSTEGTAGLTFSTGGASALVLDGSQNAQFQASVTVAGTIQGGVYTNAQETGTLQPALVSCGAGCVGTQWTNSDLNLLRYWDGAAIRSVGSFSGSESSGQVLTSSGPGSAPTWQNPTAAPTGSAGGDLSGTYPNPSVANDAITSAKILDGQVDTADLATESVTLTRLADEGGALQSIRRNAGDTAFEYYNPLDDSTAFVNGGNSFGATAVLGTNDTQNLQFETDGTTRLTIDSTGRVGVGTEAPLGQMHINGTSPVYYDRTSSNAAHIALRSANGTPGSETAVLDGDEIGQISFGGYDGSAFITNDTGVVAKATENWTSLTQSGSDLLFKTKENNIAGMAQARMSIKNDGKVGIGTTSPTEVLEVSGNIKLSGMSNGVIKPGTVGAANDLLVEGAHINAGFGVWARSTFGNNRNYGFDGGGRLQLFANGSEFVSVTNVGNVGIGTTAPNEKLTLDGAMDFKEITAPTTDVADYHKVYVDSADNKLKFRDEDGNVFDLTDTGTDNDTTYSADGEGIEVASEVFSLELDGNTLSKSTTGLKVEESNLDHGSIGGLTDDDHAQYALLAGRSGGQNLIGGTDASDNLTLESTSDATKGDLLLQPNGGSVGIGVSNPANILEVAGDNSTLISFEESSSLSGSTGAGLKFTGVSSVFSMGTLNAGPFRIEGPSLGFLELTNSATGYLGAYKLSVANGGGLAAPSIALDTTNGDESGFYLPALNQIGIITDRTERIRIDASGNIGIGTSNPSTRLEVRGKRSQKALTEINIAQNIVVEELLQRNLGTSVGDFVELFETVGLYNNNLNLELDIIDSKSGAGISQKYRISANYDEYNGTPVGDWLEVVPVYSSGLRDGYYRLETSRTATGKMAFRLRTDDAFSIVTSDTPVTVLVKNVGSLITELSASGNDANMAIPLFAQSKFTMKDGRVGIGTSSPNALLTIDGVMTLSQQGSDPSGVASYGSLYTKSNGKLYYRDGTGTITELSAAESADTLDEAYSAGSATIAVDGAGGGDVIWNLTGSNDFHIQDNGAAAFTVNDSGNVGIGTVNPFEKLEVNGNIRLTNAGTIETRNNGTLRLQAGNNNGNVILSSDDVVQVELRNADAGRNFNITSVGAGELFRVDGDTGNVGIGTPTPNAKLTIEGAMTLDQLAADPAGTADYGSLYSKTDGKLYYRDGTGAVTDLLAGGTGDFLADGSVGMTGQLRAFAGNAASPGISFSADPDTGIHPASPNQLAIATGGLNRVFIDSNLIQAPNLAITSNNLGGFHLVGTFGPTASNPTYSFSADTDTGMFRSASDEIGLSTGGTQKMTINASGNVGIGTTSPNKRLDVRGTDDNGHIHVTQEGGSSGGATVFVSQYKDTSPVTSATIMGAGSRGTFLAPAEIQNGDDVTAFVGAAASDTAWSMRDVAGIYFSAAENISNTSSAGNIKFSTTTSGSISPTEKMRIDSNGKVGIGTTSPSTELEIVGTTKTSGLFWSAFGATGTHRGLLLENFDDTANTNGTDVGVKLGGTEFQGLSWVQETSWTSASAAADKDVMIQFGVLADNVPTNPMVIKSDGSVGIGTASPGAPLDVGGAVQLNRGLGDVSVASDIWMSAQGLIAAESNLILNSDSNVSGSGDVIFKSGGETSAATNNMIIKGSDGNVGIGTTGPAYRLDINEPVTGGAQGLRVSIGASGTGSTVLDARNGSGSVLFVRGDGNIGIGTTAPTANLSVNGTANKTGGGSWATFSDARLKTVHGPFMRGLNELLRLKPISYNYNDDNPLGIKNGGDHIGFVAQDVEALIPEAISYTKDGYLMVDNDPIIWTMLNAVQEIHGICKMSQAQMDSIESRVTDNEREIASLKSQLREERASRKSLEQRLEALEKLLQNQK